MGRRVECEISFGTEINSRGLEVEQTVACCTRCGHETRSWGDSDASIKRCLAVMREECPKGENNYYIEEE